jgi:octaprenyl-diphosphate synthase
VSASFAPFGGTRGKDWVETARGTRHGGSVARRALLRLAERQSLDSVVARLETRPEAVLEYIAGLDDRLAALAGAADGPARDAVQHLVAAGGKRVRPLLCLLSTRSIPGGRADGAVELLAQAGELVHCASLLHDDVIDLGETRRGRPAARIVFGNAASVLGGDLLLVQALELAESAGIPGVLSRLLETLGRMVEAESLQLERRGCLDVSENDYFEVVAGKTAALFEWCAEAGARAAGASAPQADALRSYGAELGVAFQLVDDVLDLQRGPEEVGKSVLQDVGSGTLTFPVIRALRNRKDLRGLLRTLATGEQPSEALRLGEAIEQAGGIDAGRREVSRRTELAREALRTLPPSPARDALHLLAGQLALRLK